MDGAAEDERAIVRCGTTKGPLTLELHRRWSPRGYDRAVELFERGFYDRTHFFRVVPDFLVQFGITYSDDPELVELGNSRTIPDDPPLDPPVPFEVGTISYAGSGPDSRTSQLFFALTDRNPAFGTEPWETPVGRVVEGLAHVEQFYHAYGDGPPFGQGPAQGRIHTGRAYIDENFPLLDSFQECHTQRIPPHTKAEPKRDGPVELNEASPTPLDIKLIGGGVLFVVIVSVFLRSLFGGDSNFKKRK